MKWQRILARDAVLLALDAVLLGAQVVWCKAVGCDARWHTGSTSMACWCQRCGRLINVIPRR